MQALGLWARAASMSQASAPASCLCSSRACSRGRSCCWCSCCNWCPYTSGACQSFQGSAGRLQTLIATVPCTGKAWDCGGSGSLFGGCAGSGEHRLRQARLDHAAVNVDPQAMHLVICLELWSPPLPCAAVCPGLCLFLFAKSS